MAEECENIIQRTDPHPKGWAHICSLIPRDKNAAIKDYDALKAKYASRASS